MMMTASFIALLLYPDYYCYYRLPIVPIMQHITICDCDCLAVPCLHPPDSGAV